MYRQHVALGSLFAVVAALCVFSPAPAAATAGGFSGLLLDHTRCCLPAVAGQRVALGVEGPAAGMGPGGRATATGVVLAQSSEAPASDPAQEKPAATESPREADKMPEAPAGSEPAGEKGEDFEGSPKPAGPDLSESEERDLISRGWK